MDTVGHVKETRPLTEEEQRAARRLLNARDQQDRSYPWLEQQTGIRAQAIRRYLTTERAMSLGQFLLLCEALQVDPNAAVKAE